MGGTAIGVYNAARFTTDSRFSEGGTALGAYVPPPFAPAAEEQWYSFRSTEEEVAEEVAAAEPVAGGAAAEGETLFHQLLALDDSVSRADYFSEADGWDVAGIRSDLALYAASA